MSLMGTLAKVAVGIAVAKAAGGMMKNRGGSGNAGNGGMFGGTHSPNPRGSGGLEDMMGDILGGRSSQQSGNSGGLGGLLEGLAGGGTGRNRGMDGVLRQRPTQRGGSGGLEDLLGGLTGGQGSPMGGGGLGGLLGGLLGGAAAGRGGGFGDMLNQSIQSRGEPKRPPSREQNAAAGLMLKAMIMAAKSDGKFDQSEQEKLLGSLGEVSADERMFVQNEMQAPVDPHGLANQTPRGMEQQVYAMSIMGIDLDNQNEAKYLHTLATELELQPNTVNAIHDKFGVPRIYN